MTVDAIALCRERPDLAAVLGALPALQARPLPRGPLVQLCDGAGPPLVTLEGPTLVRVPGEVERLLGLVVDGPVWWVEARARDADAYGLARRVAQALADAAGGTVWPTP